MSNANLVVTTVATAKPGKEHVVHQALLVVAEAACKQPNCINFRVFRSIENNAITINFEEWSSEKERDTFLAGPDVEKFATAVSDAFATSPHSTSYQELE